MICWSPTTSSGERQGPRAWMQPLGVGEWRRATEELPRDEGAGMDGTEQTAARAEELQAASARRWRRGALLLSACGSGGGGRWGEGIERRGDGIEQWVCGGGQRAQEEEMGSSDALPCG